MKYLLDRLGERSTWLGLIGIVTAFGVSLSPEQAEAIIAVGSAVAGAVAVFTKG
jgi:hypothetical protein